jgi:hypothetical protein
MVIRDLIERGIAEEEREKREFFALTDALISEQDPERQKELQERLRKLTFGE